MFKFGIIIVSIVVSQLNSNPIEPLGRSTFGFENLFQGDIKLTEEQQDILDGKVKTGRTGMLDRSKLWPKNSRGIVEIPYQVNPNAGFSESLVFIFPNIAIIFIYSARDEINFLVNDIKMIEKETCVRFVPRTNQNDYIYIINNGGCYSYLGRRGGKQDLSLARPGCLYKGTPAHEAVHALGFDHMHNHIDRDRYVQVRLQNVDPQYRYAFDKVDPRWFGNYGTPYDLLSVMHYPRYAFSMNSQDTIVPYDSSYLNRIGASVVTSGDAQRIRNMYGC